MDSRDILEIAKVLTNVIGGARDLLDMAQQLSSDMQKPGAGLAEARANTRARVLDMAARAKQIQDELEREANAIQHAPT